MLEHLTTKNDREIFFPVFEQDVVGIISGLVPDNYKMLTKGDGWTDQDTCLSIVKSNYRVVENEEVLIPLQEQMVNHFDPSVLEDVQIKDHVTKGGAVCYAEYILPKMKRTVETKTGHSTDIGLRYIMKNTFDGSSSVVFYGGVIDFFCTNGQIGGQFDVARKRHTKNFQVDGFIQAFDDSIERHKHIVNQYQEWADTRIYDSRKVMDLFRTLTTGSVDNPKKRNGLSDRLFAQYMDEIQTRGKNVFSVVSAMTHYASHGDDGRFDLTKAGDNGTLFKRQEQVSKWLGSKVFADYLEVA